MRPIQALANRSHSIRRYRYYRMLGQRTETQTEHWAGARVHRRAAGAICASGLPPGRAEFARCDAEGFYFSAERQAHKTFGPARESGAGEFLGVSEDDDQQAYDEFLKTYQIPFPTFRDTSKQIPAQYGTSMYPDTYVIGRNGKLDRKIVGPQDWTSPEMTAYIDSLLDAK